MGSMWDEVKPTCRHCGSRFVAFLEEQREPLPGGRFYQTRRVSSRWRCMSCGKPFMHIEPREEEGDVPGSGS